jgi:hypothetical protein
LLQAAGETSKGERYRVKGKLSIYAAKKSEEKDGLHMAAQGLPPRGPGESCFRKVQDKAMNFKAIQILSMAVSTMVEEMTWASYGKQELHTPVVTDEKDCHRLDLLMDMMGTLTRMMDTRINYVTTEGKVIREWIESILELGRRYQRELEILERLEKRLNSLESR